MIKTSKEYSVAIIGYGKVGKAYHLVFPDATIYDPFHGDVPTDMTRANPITGEVERLILQPSKTSKDAVNKCDLALICVPTDLDKDGKLDMSIVEDAVSWIKTPLILIKSALQPGTVDRLVKATGKKIAVSVEMVGEGQYFVPYWKYPDAQNPIAHNMLIVGGEDETARRCADFLWARMSPDINIHLVSALEAEITKMMENTWGAMKVSFANAVYDVCESLGANYTKVLQAWGSDGRTEKMHMRVMPHKRGWNSKCYNKDVPAFGNLDKSGLIAAVVRANERHKAENER